MQKRFVRLSTEIARSAAIGTAARGLFVLHADVEEQANGPARTDLRAREHDGHR